MRAALVLAVLGAVVLGLAPDTSAHCQIPCGIYDDMLRIRLMEEHVTTIERSLKGIQELAGKSAPGDVNQLVRWVENKDQHADFIGEIVTEYFLRQRVKAPGTEDPAALKKYTEQLLVLHGLLVTTMKAKQTVDPEIPATLRTLIDRFKALYFTEEELAHTAQHH